MKPLLLVALLTQGPGGAQNCFFDGCNTCCWDDGGAATCTAKACVVLPPESVATEDVPRRQEMPDGSQIWNRTAVDAVDIELKRLQQVEKDARAEKERLVKNGVFFALIALGVGAAAGIAGGIVIGLAVRR